MKRPSPPSAASVYLSKWSKSSDTYKTMRAALDALATLLDPKADADTYPWHDLRYDDVRAVPAQLTDAGRAPRTINKYLSALRGVLEAAWRSGKLPDDEYRKIKITCVKGRRLPAGRALTPTEIDTIIENLPKVSPRDAAMVSVLCACGLRRIELVRLMKEDYASGRLRALGKGNKERLIPVPPRWRVGVEAWWGALEPGAPAFADGGGPVSRRQLSYVIEQFYKTFGMKKFTAHDLRRTFITRICESSDIAIAQRLAGHESLDTTGLYDRRGDEAEDEAVKDL